VYCLDANKQKKFKISLVFAEGLDHCPRQRIENKPLPRAMVKALGKEFSRKNKKICFAEGLHGSPRQRNYPNKN